MKQTTIMHTFSDVNPAMAGFETCVHQKKGTTMNGHAVVVGENDQMRQMVAFDNDNIQQITEYNHDENVAAIKESVRRVRRTTIEEALNIGKRLVLARENEPHGRWYDFLKEIDMGNDTAERLIKIAETFGDNPELLEGMTQRKAYLMATLPEENLIQLKQDEVLISANGDTYTLGEIREMTIKEFENEKLNLRNQKNAEIREWKDKAINSYTEIGAMREEYERKLKLIDEMQRDADEAMHKEIKSRDNQLAKKDKAINELEREIEERKGEMFDEIAVTEAVKTARKALEEVIYKYNMLKPGYYPQLGQKLVGFFGWVRDAFQPQFFSGDKFLEPPEHEDTPDDNYDKDGYFEPPELQ